MAASRDIFREPDAMPRPRTATGGKKSSNAPSERSRRRARGQLHEYALANEWDWFITLTLNAEVIERYDLDAIMKALRCWLDNQVRRHGLKYVLIPERHKEGGIHFHGFFAGGKLNPVFSGHYDNHGHEIYNLERWMYGFTTAIHLYGSFERAVGYVCKYMGKEKLESPIGGRWYYHGGKLDRATVTYCDVSPEELHTAYPDGYAFSVEETATEFYIARQNADEKQVIIGKR